MARDRRYSTAAWQRTRRYVIARDPYCTIQAPRCTGYSTTAHHLEPSSIAPERFFDLTNLAGACRACNFGGGAQVAADNRASRATVTRLERIVEQQADEIAELHHRLVEYEHPQPRPIPAIR